MRILLVNPPFYRLMGTHYNGMSLGIGYIASSLNRHGHEAWTYNADFLPIDYYKTAHDLYLSFPSYVEIFQDTSHPIWQETIDSIVAFKPDLVGFTSYTANITTIKLLSSLLKERMPEVKQVVGGVQATLDPFNILNVLPDVDYAIIREGEVTLLSVADGQDSSSIAGLCYRKDGEVCINAAGLPIEDLDSLAYPERDKLWTHGGRPATAAEKTIMDVSYMITIRGCPYRCTFCASPAVWGRKNVRYRDADCLIDEMEYLRNNYWTQHHVDYGMLSSNSETKGSLLDKSLQIKDNTIVYFVDDVFTIKKNRASKVMQRMVDRQVNVPWKCESRADNIDQELADLMAASGCKRVKIGFESGSDKILKQIKKDETKEQMLEGARCLKQAGIPITAYFMAGFPGETDDDLKQTIEFAKQIDANYCSLSILAPYYGTQIYHNALDQGQIQLDKEPWEYFFHQSKKLLVNDSLSEEVLKEFWKLSEPKNYV